MFRNNKTKIGLIGLGYVGLPLAVEFGKKFPVIGFDTKSSWPAHLATLEDENRL